jgi:predicted dehydrogenase
MENTTLAIVGLGNHGRLMADYLVEEPIQLIGFDASDELRREFEADYDIPTVSNVDISEEPECDGAIVTLPNSIHADLTIKALEMDVDVLVETPLARSISEIDRIRTVANESDANCLVNLYHRCIPAARLLESLVSEDTLGSIEFVYARFTRQYGVPAYGSWLTSKQIAGGGVLMDLGVHAIDLSLWLLQFPEVADVHASIGEASRTYSWTGVDKFGTDRELGSEMFDVEDRAFLTIEIEDGPTVALETAWADGQPDEHSYRVNGSKGAAKLDISNFAQNPTLRVQQTDDSPLEHYVEQRFKPHHSPNPLHAMLKHFVEVVTGDSEPTQRFEEHAAVHRIFEKSYQERS